MLPTSITNQLTERQENFFLWIYQQCVKDYKITISDKEISKQTAVPVSTIEKYLKKFDDLGLIVRATSKMMNQYVNRWETKSREIVLNDEMFDPFMLEKIRQDNIERALSYLKLPIAQIERMKQAHNK